MQTTINFGLGMCVCLDREKIHQNLQWQKNPNFQGKIWQKQVWEKLNRKLNFFKSYLFVQHRFVVPSDVHPFFQAESVLNACFIDDSECRIITSFTAITWTACVFSQVLVNCTRSRALIKVLMDPSWVMIYIYIWLDLLINSYWKDTKLTNKVLVEASRN